MRKTIGGIFAVAALAAVASCGQAMPDYRAVPPGYACRVLTPNGFEGNWYEAGQMNLGGTGAGGIQNRAVCLEVTTVQVKEQFAPASGDQPDNRILTRTGQRIGVDFYVRLVVPSDHAVWDSVIAQITPRTSREDPRMSYVRVSDIYERFGRQEARSYGRATMVGYEDDIAMNNSRPQIENALSQALVARLRELQAPLNLQGISVSNIQADAAVQEARNNALTAESVRQVASSYSPSYVEMQRIQAQERMIARITADDQPHTIIFGIGGENVSVPTRRE